MSFLAPILASVGGSLIGNMFGGSKSKSSSGGSSSSGKIKQTNTMTPEQLKFLKQLYSQHGGFDKSPLYQAGQQNLMGLLGGDYNAFEGPIMQKYQEQIIPQIAERFGAATGGRANSGLNNALAMAARSLATDLAGQRANLNLSALGQGLQYAQQPISNQLSGLGAQAFQPYMMQPQPQQPSMLQGFGQGVLGSFAQGAGNYLTKSIFG